jgi:hypothetical protein
LETLLLDGKKRRDGAIIFGAIGALVGTIVGVLTNTPEWEVVATDGITVTISPKFAAPGMQGTLRF